MILLELFQREAAAYQDLAQDNSQPRLGDLRKTKLTLRQINKLRQLQDVRTYEFRQRLEQIQDQYAPVMPPAI